MSGTPTSPPQPVSVAQPAVHGTAAAPQLPGGRIRHPRLVLVIGGLAGLVFVLYVSTRIFGGVSGEEFSPDLFERRTFDYYEIPLVRLQITPISRQDRTNPLEQYLRSQKLVRIDRTGEPRWDLVQARQPGRGLAVGDAQILSAYLDAKAKDGTYVWQAWTEQHPKLGKILWSEVDRLADQQLYLFIPDLFEVASRATESSTFQQNVDRALADRYELLALAQQQLGNLNTARELLAEALRRAPQRKSLQQLQQAIGPR